MTKRITQLAIVLICLLLPLAVFIFWLEHYAFSIDFYMQQFEDYDAQANTGMSRESLRLVTQRLISYLKGETDDLSISASIAGNTKQVFGQREISHMEDVQHLFDLAEKIKIWAFTIVGLLALGLLLTGRYRTFAKSLLYSGLLSLLFVLFLLSLTILDFRAYFDKFHELFFSNDLWLLNPKTDTLIQMLPLQFFISIVQSIMVAFSTTMLVLGLGGGFSCYKHRYN